uniref:PDZ domain-containing protein n=1 Tax=Alexandrium monilatum TaxID=311494 RepID=A0A7S4PZV0_9DINO
MPSSVGVHDHAVGSKPSRQVKDNFVNRVVQRCGPAVVRVETEQRVELPGVDNADIFSFFFGVRPEARRQERRVSGHGSGFCIDGNSGVILTNAHVVQGADRITASFAGRGDPLECEVLETDEVIDLAAIKVKGRLAAPLPSMQLGASETVRTGDWAIVLGNPLGLQNTCTLGIVSSLDRSTGETGFDWMRHPLLQTDAAVNQGNSGGPMINELGEVIGVISMRALFGEGIGFAIPVDSIKSALPSLLNRTKVPRSFLGLKMTAERPDGGRRPEGALVELVLPRSPAEAAGLEAGDEIVEVQGRKVKHFDEVQTAVRSAQVGSKLSFKVRHKGESRSVNIKTADIRQLREGGSDGRSPRGGRRRIVILPH